MNPKGEKDRYKKVADQSRLMNFIGIIRQQLHFYSLSFNDILKAQKVIEKHRGPLSFLSHKGTKDLILNSTGNPMPLYHVQWGALKDPKAEQAPKEEGIHMFCSPSDNPLTKEVEDCLGHRPSATATIYASRLMTDFEFILSSDI